MMTKALHFSLKYLYLDRLKNDIHPNGYLYLTMNNDK
jgi:hypothetical protein